MLVNMFMILVHPLEYYMTENKLINYRIYAGETMAISIRFHISDRHHIDHSEEDRNHAYTPTITGPKSRGVLVRDKQMPKDCFNEKSSVQFDSRLSGVGSEDTQAHNECRNTMFHTICT